MLELQSEQDVFHYPVPGICVVLALIYLSPIAGSLPNYIAFLLCIYRLLRYDVRVFSIDYCCLVSVATVFALPNGLSLVVVLSLIAIIWFFIRNGFCADSSIVILLILICYLVARMQSSVNDFVLCVSQLLLIYLMISFIDSDAIILSIECFIGNVAISSCYALIFRHTSMIINIIGNEVPAYLGSSMTRFQGLCRDPNYYMSLIIMAIVLLTLLRFREYISKQLFFLGIGSMFVFGALTYSKTFLILLGLYWILCVIDLFRSRHWRIATALIIGTPILAILLADTLFATTFYRIISTSSISELTTGRSSLFAIYFREILSSVKVFFVGEGMSADILKKGTHNLFLEIHYYVGLIGLGLYILYFIKLGNWVKRKYRAYKESSSLFNYASLIIFIALFCSLQGMFSISVYALLYLAIISIGIDVSNRDSKQEQRGL